MYGPPPSAVTPEPSAHSDDLHAQWARRRGRFADDVDVSASFWRRVLWVSAGLVAAALGLVGAFLPVLPTTPFMVLAAACFARSSARFYNLLLSHRVFGPLIFTWQRTRTIPPRAKAVAIALIVVTFAISIVFFVPNVLGRVTMALVGGVVAIWLYRVPSAR